MGFYLFCLTGILVRFKAFQIYSILFRRTNGNIWHGGVPERSNGAVSKTAVSILRDRGFESLHLRIDLSFAATGHAWIRLVFVAPFMVYENY